MLGNVGERHVDIQFKADDLAVLRNQFGSADVDADLHVSGIRVAVDQRHHRANTGRLEVAQILERTTRTPYSTEAQAPPRGDVRPRRRHFDRTAIDVKIKIPDNLVLRGRDLRVSNSSFGIGDMNILVGGDFAMTKAMNEQLSVVGSADVAQGYYSFQGRRFEVERGSDVRFRGGPPTDPTINFTGTREVAGITAQVRVQGTPSSPQITLSSQPPLDEGDILSLIVFNQPMSQLGTSERMNLGERAAALAAGAIATPLADSIGRVLNLDVVEAGADDRGRIRRVHVGTGLTAVFAGCGRLRPRRGQRFTLEHRINEVLRL